jgi:23S rRNA (adenine2503-C2)-methyltransferase
MWSKKHAYVCFKKLKGTIMTAKYPTDFLSDKSSLNLFLNPTNCLYSEFESHFGKQSADSIFSSLYTQTKQSAYRQIIPVNIVHDSSTTKYVFKLHDNRQIETVCIKRKTGITVCLSTQVGCSIGCLFCESGKNGFYRNLTASEIVQQFLFVDESINRIVFMGIGEPLNNYDEVIRAIHILRDRKGIDFPTDGISISTVGPIPKLVRLKQESLKIQLVISLHATDQETRDYLIPGMRRYSINEIISEAFAYQRKHNRKLSIAYLLLPGINDSDGNVGKLIQWFSNKNVVINLMKYNGINSQRFTTATEKCIQLFKTKLTNAGLEVTVRESTGTGLNAACGQLIAKIN